MTTIKLIVLVVILGLLTLPLIAADPLSITISGKGYVTSSFPYWISCAASCSKDINPGAEVTLRATSQENSQFLGWSGACSGSDTSCTLTVRGTTSIMAQFSGEVVKEYQLTATRVGQGSIESTPTGISVGTTFDYDYAKFSEGTTVKVTAKPTPNSQFSRFEGDCTSIIKETCTVIMNGEKSVRVIFTAATPAPVKESCGKENQKACNPCPSSIGCINGCFSPYFKINNNCASCPADKIYVQGICAPRVSEKVKLIVTKQGHGTISDTEGKINCGNSCSASYLRNSRVILTSTPNPGAFFWGWTGACSGKNECAVNLTSTRNVGAKFYNEHVLVINKTKRGAVKSDDGKIDCGSVCQASYPNGTTVTLRPWFDFFSDVSFLSWTGDCSGRDSCVVTINSPKKVGAVFNASIYNLTVIKKGNGNVNGIVPGGFNFSCIENTCTAFKWYYSGGYVPLQLAPTRDTIIERVDWDCDSHGLSCAVPMNDDKEVIIHSSINTSYVPPEMAPFTLSLSVQGSGRIIANDGNTTAECRNDCNITLRTRNYVALSARANDGNQLVGWGGKCTNTTVGPCVFTSSGENVTVSARFDTSFKVMVQKRGKGTGTVVSEPLIPVGINCGPACKEAFNWFAGDVLLKATPSPGYVFIGWNWECYPPWSRSCWVTATENATIFARFDECEYNRDCSWNQECKNYACVPISCSCGEINDHRCEKYDCCSDADCPYGTCNTEANLCVDKNECYFVYGGPERDQARIDILVLGDNFPSNKVLEETIDDIFDPQGKDRGTRLFQIPPFRTYKDRFNIWMKNAPELAHPDGERPSVDTALAARVGCRRDVIVVLSKSSYRSFAHFPTSGYWGGLAFVSLRDSGGDANYNADLNAGTLAHELGHALGHLADEYTEAGKGSYTDSINCALDRYTAEQRWGDLDYLPGVGYITGGTDGGCSYSESHVRPTEDSIMRYSDSDNGYGPVNTRELENAIEWYR